MHRGAGRAGQAEARRVGERAVRGAGRGELGRGVGRAVREGQATGARGKGWAGLIAGLGTGFGLRRWDGPRLGPGHGLGCCWVWGLLSFSLLYSNSNTNHSNSN